MLILLITEDNDKFLVSAPDKKRLTERIEDIFGGIKAEIKEETIVLTGVEKLKPEYRDAIEEGSIIIDDPSKMFEFKDNDTYTFTFKVITSLQEVEELASSGISLEKCL